MLLALSLACGLIFGVSLLGGILPLSAVLNHTRLQVYLSFSAGSMLGAAFFHMLPEAVQMGTPQTVRWTAVGLLALFFLERFFSFHHHEPQSPQGMAEHADHHEEGDRSFELEHVHPASGCRHEHRHPPRAPALTTYSWGTAAFGLAVHSLVGGVALASAISADHAGSRGVGAVGWGVFLATIIHKPADALTIVSLMLGGGVSRRLAHLVNAAFALMIPLGALIFECGLRQLSPGAAADWTAVALAFSAGTFLCIALSDLLPELQFHSHDRLKLSISLIAGFCLMAGTSILEFV